MREKWLRIRFDDNRWWATTILVAIAVWATPMNPVVHGVVALVAWVLAIISFAVSITWDYCRWHWPFLPFALQRQIEKAEQIKSSAATKEVEQWREQTAEVIRQSWGYESNQYRKFAELPAQPNRLTEIDILLSTLKEMDPR